MADSMNATLSDPAFENQETLNAPVSNSEQLHNADTVINEDKTQVKQEKSAVDPEFMEVPKKELINVKEAAENVKEVAGNVKEAAGKFAAKNVAEMKKLLPTNFLRRALSFLMYFGLVIPILTIMNTFVFGLKQEGKGKIQELSKKNKGFVLTCNHVHPMDCTWLGVLTTPRKMVYTSMEGNFKIPVVGPFIRFFDCVPISTTIKGLRNFMNEMTDAVKRGRVVGMYPEGSIEMYCDHLRKFSDGAFTIAVDANAPVLPVVITPRERKGLWKLLKRGSCITITVGDPVYPEDCGSHRKTVRKLREDVEAEMNHLLEIGGKAYPKEPLHDEGAFWRTGKKNKKN